MKIAIIGKGGHSKVIQDIISLHSRLKIVAYLDDKYDELSRKEDIFFGPILAAEIINDMFKDVKFIIAIGNNKLRRLIVNQLKLTKESYVTLIHPTATISISAKIGCGSVVMAHTVINADTHIGEHTIINTASVIEHDNQLGDFVHISPNATLTGAVKIEDGAQVGAGATIIPKIKIGKWSVIGAGATVIHSIPPYCTAVGVPAIVKNNQLIEGV
ncbi:acetyltransferase [Bacillus sp. FSL K6-3431]|uniref:acetyltransferase n=1 Tax=Bacillus sp. FSL K6-3431 TaxID=2921500 RepID=UPI0030F6C2A5